MCNFKLISKYLNGVIHLSVRMLLFIASFSEINKLCCSAFSCIKHCSINISNGPKKSLSKMYDTGVTIEFMLQTCPYVTLKMPNCNIIKFKFNDISKFNLIQFNSNSSVIPFKLISNSNSNKFQIQFEFQF